MHKYSHKLQRNPLSVMLFFLFLISLFLMRHVGRHCNSSGRSTLFNNPSVPVFLASTHTRTHHNLGLPPLQPGAKCCGLVYRQSAAQQEAL